MFAVVIVLAFASGSLSRPTDDPAWKQYKFEFEKVYENEEEEGARYEIWKQTLNEIEVHNGEYSNTYKQGVNEFSDMSGAEFEKKMTGCFKIPETYFKGNVTTRGEAFIAPPPNVKLPDSVNWATKGYVTPIKSQKNCGSCYAFSATGALEGQWFRKTGRLVSLSEQQILDCSRKWGTRGCGGGWYQSAWDYIRDVHGSDTETSYPYEAKVGDCRFKRESIGATVRKYVDLKSEDENALKQAVATIGPVSVAISVQGSLKRYTHGVYYEKSCQHEFWQLNHAVLVVGYGTENGQEYWLVKNSWGSRFGEGGYMKMARNRRNNCGIATIPSYPVI